MSKRCARCEKAVYPLEELKCLDKIWHKGCFKCQECAMTLSMKTYKGFNKLPYCEAHIPKAKATTVAETPEMRRLAENTKIQSNVQYHADFEKNKAKFTQVADDPETQRLKKNTQIISNVVYHGEMAKKSEMERKRAEPNDENEEWSSSWHDSVGEDVSASVHQSKASHFQHDNNDDDKGYDDKAYDDRAYEYGQDVSEPSPHRHPSPSPHRHQSYPRQYSPAPQDYPPQHSRGRSISPDYSDHYADPQGYPSSSPSQAYTGRDPYYPPDYAEDDGYYPGGDSPGGYIDPNDPYSAQPPMGPGGSPPHSTNRHYPTNNYYAMHQQPTRRVGSIEDYDPVNEQYGSISQQNANPAGGGYRQETTYQVQRSNMYDQNMGGQQAPPPQMNSNPAHHKVNAPPTQLGRCYRAMYDYEAADTDEVSFKDGDLIINCTAIDEGWMTGTIQRTGVTGMLPANYVERVS